MLMIECEDLQRELQGLVCGACAHNILSFALFWTRTPLDASRLMVWQLCRREKLPACVRLKRQDLQQRRQAQESLQNSHADDCLLSLQQARRR